MKSPLLLNPIVVTAVVAAAGPSIVRIVTGSLQTEPWNATLWLFDYRHGFIQRGLLGQVLVSAGLSPTYATIHTVSVWMALAGSAAFLAYVVGSLGPFAGSPSVALLAAYLITLPGALQQYFMDLGRFDVELGLILLAGMAIVTGSRRSGWALWWTGCLSVAAIFIHEVAFLWIAPLLLSCWMLRFPSRRNVAIAAATMAALAGLTYVTSWSVLTSRLPIDDYYRYLSAKTDFTVNREAILIQYHDALGAYVAHFTPAGSRGPGPVRIAGAVLTALPMLLIGARTIAASRRSADPAWRYQIACVVAALPPLALWSLPDLPRWIAMSTTGLAISLLGLCRNGAGRSVVKQAGTFRLLLALGAILNVVAGPYGTTDLFVG